MVSRNIDELWTWSVTFAAFLMNLLIIGFVKSFTLLVTDLREYFQTSTSIIMLAGGLVVSLIALISPIASFLCDRYTTRYTVLCASVSVSICFVVSSFVRDPMYLVLLFAVIGVCFSMCYISVISMLPRCHRKRHALSSGIAMSGSSAGLILMAPLVLFLLSRYHVTQTLFILGAIFLNLAVSAILMPEMIYDSKTDVAIYKEGKYRSKERENSSINSGSNYFSFINGKFVLYVLAACMGNIGITGQYTIYAGFSGEHGISNFHIGLGLVLQGVLDMGVRIFAGWIGDLKILPHWVYLVVSLIVMSTNAILSALMAVYQPSYAFWMIYSCLLVISGSFYQIYVFLEASSIIGVKNFGRAFSFNLMFLGITNTPSQYFLGYLKDFTGRYIWSLISCSFISCASALIFLGYRVAPRFVENTKEISIDVEDTNLHLLKDKNVDRVEKNVLNTNVPVNHSANI